MTVQQTQRFLRPKGQTQSLLVPLKIPLEKCLRSISDESYLCKSRGENSMVKRQVSLERCVHIARGCISHPQLPVSPV